MPVPGHGMLGGDVATSPEATDAAPRARPAPTCRRRGSTSPTSSRRRRAGSFAGVGGPRQRRRRHGGARPLAGQLPGCPRARWPWSCCSSATTPWSRPPVPRRTSRRPLDVPSAPGGGWTASFGRPDVLLDLDLSDPRNPVLARSETFSGSILALRQYGDVVRVVTSTPRPGPRLGDSRDRARPGGGDRPEPAARRGVADRGLAALGHHHRRVGRHRAGALRGRVHHGDGHRPGHPGDLDLAGGHARRAHVGRADHGLPGRLLLGGPALRRRPGLAAGECGWPGGHGQLHRPGGDPAARLHPVRRPDGVPRLGARRGHRAGPVVPRRARRPAPGGGHPATGPGAARRRALRAGPPAHGGDGARRARPGPGAGRLGRRPGPRAAGDGVRWFDDFAVAGRPSGRPTRSTPSTCATPTTRWPAGRWRSRATRATCTPWAARWSWAWGSPAPPGRPDRRPARPGRPGRVFDVADRPIPTPDDRVVRARHRLRRGAGAAGLRVAAVATGGAGPGAAPPPRPGQSARVSGEVSAEAAGRRRPGRLGRYTGPGDGWSCCASYATGR